MMIDNIFKLILKSNDWNSVEKQNYKLFAKGYCFYNDRYYNGHDIIEPFLDILEEGTNDVNHLFNQLNGCWAAIIYHENTKEIQLVSDRYRSVPLFYAVKEDAVIVSDNSHSIEAIVQDTEIDATSELQFLLSGFVTGDKTLFKDIHQVEPGTSISITNGKDELNTQYFTFFPALKAPEKVTDLETELKSIIYKIKDRLKAACKDKRVFVPLSGGNDSRLIMWMLSESGIKDVICYTYGVSDNPQLKIAQQIAERLGYEWYFIAYSKDKWKQSLEQGTIEDFFLFSANGTSLPHIQDYAAVKALHEKGLITDNSIFLPGHVGDAWANEFASKTLDEAYPLPPQEYHSGYMDIFGSDIISFIVYRHLMFFPVTKKQWETKEFTAVIDKIKGEIAQYKSNREGDIWKALEWILRSRTSLWIVNSVRTYEYHNATFYLPLADYELINFLQKLPLDHVLDRNLYTRVVSRIFNDSTNEAAVKLKNVEVRSGGTRNNGLKRKVIYITKKLGVYDVYERYKHKHRSERNLNFEHWFTEGKRSESITLDTILRHRHVNNYLNPAFFKVIKRYIKKPSYVIHCNGLLSLIFIKTFKQNFESK